jgi:hypothetical protein
MAHSESSPFEDPADPAPFLMPLNQWEVALHSLSRLAVLIALSLALILILGQQLGQPA